MPGIFIGFSVVDHLSSFRPSPSSVIFHLPTLQPLLNSLNTVSRCHSKDNLCDQTIIILARIEEITIVRNFFREASYQ